VKVTGKTFNEIVMDRTKDVIVEFYDPNCKHCKAFNPIWELLGEVLCDVDSIVVAQMDAMNNDVPSGKMTCNLR
jgi:thioredoxin-like negative regulator of GroEL